MYAVKKLIRFVVLNNNYYFTYNYYPALMQPDKSNTKKTKPGKPANTTARILYLPHLLYTEIKAENLEEERAGLRKNTEQTMYELLVDGIRLRRLLRFINQPDAALGPPEVARQLEGLLERKEVNFQVQ